MPISIPMMQRRSSAANLGAVEAAAAVRGASTFVPPHMLHRQEGEEGGQLAAEVGPSLGLGLSPSASAKREKLLARNAILRSTGFIEVQQPAAAVIGESSAGRVAPACGPWGRLHADAERAVPAGAAAFEGERAGWSADCSKCPLASATHPPAACPVASCLAGELLDPVKDQLLASAQAVPVPGLRADGRAAPRSSLTQLLGTSK